MFAKNALVAAAALVAAMAAQAQSVSVYGNVDVSVGSFEDDAMLAHHTTRVENGLLTGSFLGFKGQEDLGGGLKAFFKLESEIGADTGAAGGATSVGTGFWNRTSEIGLAGTFGTLTAGNSMSLLGRANQAQSPFSVYGGLGLGGAEVATTLALYQANTVTFTSQSYSGFSGAAQYGASETRGKDSIYALQGNYAQGAVAAGVTYTEGVGEALWQFGGSFDLGSAKLFAQYANANIYGTKNDTDSYHLGVSVPVSSADTVLAAWTHIKQKNVVKADDLSVAYDHALSKRTGVYGALNYVQFKPNGSDSHSGVSVAAGLRHSF